MFTINAPNLPTETAAQPGAVVGTTGGSGTVGGVIGAIALTQPASIPTTETATVTDGEATLTEPFISIGRITSNGVVISPDYYSFDPYQLTITFVGYTPTTGTIQIEGFEAAPVVSDEVTDNLPGIFKRLTIKDGIEWGCDLEGHPSGSFTCIANRSNLRDLLSALRKGTEISIYGEGLRVAGITRTDKRQAIGNDIELRISLEGMWLDPLDDTIRWREQNSDKAVFDRSTKANINKFARRAGVPYKGVKLNIPIPEDVTPEDGTSLGELLTPERVHCKGRILDYSRKQGIKTPNPDKVSRWKYHEKQLVFDQSFEIDYQGVGSPQEFNPDRSFKIPAMKTGLPSTVTAEDEWAIAAEPDVSGRAVEFANILLTGDFLKESEADDREDLQGQSQNDAPPRWRQVREEIDIVEEGDPSPGFPPFGAQTIKDLSVLFSKTGDNKVFSRTAKTKSGAIIWTETYRYGFQFLARDVATENDDGGFVINGSPLSHWKIIEYLRSTYLYDDKTGYFLGVDERGFQSVRYKEESGSSPESLTLEEEDEIKPYKYFRLPIASRERILLVPHRTYYGDISDADRYETYEVTLSDGTTTTRRKNNPNYAEPMFRISYMRDYRGFASMPDPNSTKDNPLPDLITGKEENTRINLNVRSGSKGLIFTGELDDQRQKLLNQQDRYSEYTAQFSAQDAQYRNSLDQKSFKEFIGRPGVAERLSDRFELAPRDSDQGEANNQTDREEERQTRRHLTTPGYSKEDPIGGSISVNDALTLEEALTAVRLEAYLEQIRNGDSDSLRVPFNRQIRNMDELTYIASGERRKRRVLGYRHRLTIVGTDTNGQLIVRGQTTLNLGRDLDIREDISLTTSRVPASSERPDDDQGSSDTESGGITVNRKGFTLGALFGSFGRNRLRY